MFRPQLSNGEVRKYTKTQSVYLVEERQNSQTIVVVHGRAYIAISLLVKHHMKLHGKAKSIKQNALKKFLKANIWRHIKNARRAQAVSVFDSFIKQISRKYFQHAL